MTSRSAASQPTSADRLVEVLRGSSWFMRVLGTARARGLPGWWIGAGVMRDLLWDERHGGFDPARVKDVDLVYFDPHDLRPEREHTAERLLSQALPGVPWEVKNQAAVHLWYEHRFGVPVEPLTSMAEAVATWPETTTAVAVTLRQDGTIDVLAPLGLDDLLGGVWRHNPLRATVAAYRDRLTAKRPDARWPSVRVV